MMFEDLYHEPSLGILVGLVRHYIHRMEAASREEVSGCHRFSHAKFRRVLVFCATLEANFFWCRGRMKVFLTSCT